MADVPRNALVIAGQNFDLDSDCPKGSYGIGGIAFWRIDEKGKAGKCQLGLVAAHGVSVAPTLGRPRPKPDSRPRQTVRTFAADCAALDRRAAGICRRPAGTP